MTLQKVLFYYRLEDFGSKTKYFREYLILFLKPKQHILHITFVTRSNRMFIFDKTIDTSRNYWRHKINTSKFVKYLKRNTACIWHHLIFTISFYCNFQHKNFRYLFLQKIYFFFSSTIDLFFIHLTNKFVNSRCAVRRSLLVATAQYNFRL